MPRAAPAFQFYAGDFDAATATMTAAEVGIYIRLLCVQWERGHIPSSPKRMAGAARVSMGEMEEAWEVLEEKFPEDEDGHRRNPRLERVREEQEAYREAKSKAGKKGAAARWGGGANSSASSSANSNASSAANSDAYGKQHGKRHGKTMALRSPSPTPTTTPSPTPDSMGESANAGAREAPNSEAWADRQEEEFERFWSVYPVKDRKIDAQRAWARTVEDRPPIEELLDHVDRMKRTDRWREGYAPNPATYLEQHGWESVPETLNRPRSSSRDDDALPTFQKPEPQESTELEDARQSVRWMLEDLDHEVDEDLYDRLEECSTIGEVYEVRDQARSLAAKGAG